MGRIVHILRAVAATPWAIQAEKLEAMLEVLELRAAGVGFSAEEIQARIGEPRSASFQRAGAVAIVPIRGVLAQHGGLIEESSGMSSMDSIGAMFDQAMADPEVGSIVFDVDSPGGSVYGAEELSAKIASGRGQKRIIAVANSLMASAAYWIASGADEIVASPSADTGSIGVYGVHIDTSKMDETDGLKREVISAGKFKAEALPGMPLSDEAREAFQAKVNEAYDMFTARVAKNRGVTPAAVRSGYGEGRALGAKKAKEAGLIDRIDTLENVVAKLLPRSPRAAGKRADFLQKQLAVDTAKLIS